MRIMVPSVQYQVERHSLAPRPTTLDGKTVAFVDTAGYPQPDGSIKMYPLMSELKRLLEKRFKLAGCLWYQRTNPTHTLSEEVIRDIAEKSDVIINGECWGSETVNIVRDAVELEKLGKPTITLAYETIRALWVTVTTAEGMPDLPLLIEEQPAVGNISVNPEETAEANIERVLSSLTSK
ncbi:hypothetical protein ACFLWC_04455 [Chloroflexota bacterium]